MINVCEIFYTWLETNNLFTYLNIINYSILYRVFLWLGDEMVLDVAVLRVNRKNKTSNRHYCTFQPFVSVHRSPASGWSRFHEAEESGLFRVRAHFMWGAGGRTLMLSGRRTIGKDSKGTKDEKQHTSSVCLPGRFGFLAWGEAGRSEVQVPAKPTKPLFYVPTRVYLSLNTPTSVPDAKN